jgi:hypothetical protein
MVRPLCRTLLLLLCGCEPAAPKGIGAPCDEGQACDPGLVCAVDPDEEYSPLESPNGECSVPCNGDLDCEFRGQPCSGCYREADPPVCVLELSKCIK